MGAENSIMVKGLRKSFKDVHVLKGIDLSVERGTILALLGPNGAGKTTTVRILSTLLLPDAGDVRVNGYDVVTRSDDVRALIGLTGQYAAVDEYLTGEENLLMMARLYRLSIPDSKRRTQELLKQFDLEDAADRPVKTYSGGMRRRIDLAMSLIASPPILFLDEPTTGLDPRSRLALWAIIKRLAADGTTILLTTQYMEEADRLADRIVVIDGGKVIAEGTADELKRRVGSERLEITVAKTSDFAAAKAAIHDKSLRADSKRRTLSLAAQGGSHQLKRIFDQLEKADVEIENISLHRPTLDDVFLAFTGHAASEEGRDE